MDTAFSNDDLKFQSEIRDFIKKITHKNLEIQLIQKENLVKSSLEKILPLGIRS